MSNTASYSLPQAARRLGVPVRVLRHAIRADHVPAPAHLSATVALSPEWLASVHAAVAATPTALSRAFTQKVPPFARYEGTSAWRKYANRVRDYARFRAAQAHAEAAAPTQA